LSKIAAIIAHIEKQAVELHAQREQVKDAFAAQNRANERVQALARERDTLQTRINALVEESREIRARITSMEHARKNAATMCLSQTITDAVSLIDRDDLTDAEKVRSISGLLDQVLPNRKRKAPFFVKDEDEPAPPSTVPKSRKARTTRPKGEATAPEAETASEDAEDERERERENEDEDAREFARDY
jgi:hypothetical protein